MAQSAVSGICVLCVLNLKPLREKIFTQGRKGWRKVE